MSSKTREPIFPVVLEGVPGPVPQGVQPCEVSHDVSTFRPLCDGRPQTFLGRVDRVRRFRWGIFEYGKHVVNDATSAEVRGSANRIGGLRDCLFAPAKGWVRVGSLGLSLSRSIGFSTWEADPLDPHGHALEDLKDVPDPIARIAVEDIVLRALALQLGQEQAEVVEEAVQFLYRAASNTYEGQAVHINLLLDMNLSGDGTQSISLRDYEQVDWHALVGSGLHTGILVNSDGQVVRVLDVQGNADERLNGYTLYSEAFRELAAWTTMGEQRIALSLSRSREIVVHQEGLLHYIHRSGRWRALALDHAVDSGWATGSSFSKSLKRAVLASAIDALGHHGACLGILARREKPLHSGRGSGSKGPLAREHSSQPLRR